MGTKNIVQIGDQTVDVPANAQVFVQGQAGFLLHYVDDDGNQVPMKASERGELVRFSTKEACKIRVQAPKLMHTAMEIRLPYEEVSDIPVEVDIDTAPLSLDQQIKAFCRDLVQHEFGRDSEQMDTFDEMFDFDEEDDNQAPLSGLEVKEMEDEILEPASVDNSDPVDSDNSVDDSGGAVDETPK
jgi:hypothetical protein